MATNKKDAEVENTTPNNSTSADKKITSVYVSAGSSVNKQGETLTIVGFGGLRPYEKDGKEIGHVTTGYLSPTLGTRIGNALIDVEYKGIGNTFDVMVRNKPVEAKIISKKFLEARGDHHKNK